MLTDISVEQALEILQSKVKSPGQSENKDILDALGRVASSDIFSPLDNPPFNKSPLDGYALRAEESFGASKNHPVKLKVVTRLFAGDSTGLILEKGCAVRIMTGAPIPEGADCVIRQELTDSGEDYVNIYASLKPFENFCFQGEDYKKGDLLIGKGEKLNYIHIALLASMGISKVSVYKKPRVAVLVTGDELINPGEKLTEGKIFNSNLYLVGARLKELSFTPVFFENAGDDVNEICRKLKEAVSVSDFVITTGGVSVGQKDLFHQVLPLMEAERIFWRVNLKPGTPLIFSVYKDTPILSLSGNPFAASATLELFARPVLAKLSGDFTLIPEEVTGRMDNSFPKESKGLRFIRGYYDKGKVLIPETGHSSGVLGSMKGCNCLVKIEPGNKGLSPGDEVRLLLL